MKKLNKKGFTLAELLIVVAIIAVLVAIAIPIFTAQLEKAREATDAANIRAAYAEVVANKVSGSSEGLSKTVTLKQEQEGWQNNFELPANLDETTSPAAVEPSKSLTVTIAATDTGATCTVKKPTASSGSGS